MDITILKPLKQYGLQHMPISASVAMQYHGYECHPNDIDIMVPAGWEDRLYSMGFKEKACILKRIAFESPCKKIDAVINYDTKWAYPGLTWEEYMAEMSYYGVYRFESQRSLYKFYTHMNRSKDQPKIQWLGDLILI